MEQQATVKREFVIDRQGKQFVTYQGLLDLGHAQGLKAITTDIIQFGTADNDHTWLFRAIVTTDRGTFTGFGDASPANVSRAMLNCLPRFAETRAKARALRDAVNVGVAALEELGDDDIEQHPAPRPAPRPQPPTGIAPPPREPTPIQNGQPISDNQRKAIFAIMKSIGWDADMIEDDCQHRYGVKVGQLSRTQASEFIDVLKGLQEKAAR